ncbi:MAG TPA: dihydrofolate reductase [Candidatus Paceibacterota bacterium]
MTKPRISIIAALSSKTRAIGKAGSLIWHIPGDLPRFKSLTMGHPIIMGRKTFESIGRVLPGRTNIVLTQSAKFKTQSSNFGYLVAESLEQALEIARAENSDEIFIIGGGEIYKQALPYTDRLYLTIVDSNAEGDVYFPEYENEFEVVKKEEGSPAGPDNPPFHFEIRERARSLLPG